jgi:exonuclease VII small subunit
MRHELSQIHEILSQFALENKRLNQIVTKLELSNAKLEQSNAKLEQSNAELEQTNAKLSIENNRLTQDLEAANSRIFALEDSLSRSWREKERSEKGGTGTSGGGDSGNDPPSGGNGGGGDGGDMGPKSYKALYFKLLEVADRNLNWHIFAADAKKSPQSFWLSIGSAFELIPPVEDLMSTSQTKEIDSKKSLRFSQEEKLAMFKKTKGIHSSSDTSVRYDVTLRVEKITVTHETLRDESQPGVGDQCLTARKTCNSFLPNSQVTIGTLIFMIKLHNELKMPLRRIERLFPQSYFSAENIGRWISSAADYFLPIYLHLADLLKLSKYFFTDDTNTFTLQLIKEARGATHKADVELSAEDWEKFFNNNGDKSKKNRKPDLISPVTKRLGRVAQYANGKGGKIKVNLTLLAGKSDESDWRSMICFYRTHCGQAGNLISRIFSPIVIPKASETPVVIPNKSTEIIDIFPHCDCSDQNNIEEDLRKNIMVTYVGCSDHARRPFKRYSSEDENLAYYCLIQFLEIYRLEREIKCGPLTPERVLKIRSRAWEYWNNLLEISKIVIAGQCSIIVKNRVHSSTSNLFKACKYIANHFDKLTIYITNPQLSQTNGYSERKLRVEKLFVNSSKFSFSELGSVTKDILQTMIATAISAGADQEEYFGWVLSHTKTEIAANPQLFTPLAFVKMNESKLQKNNTNTTEIDAVTIH